jgi:predicted nuclease with RNAse H fold
MTPVEMLRECLEFDVEAVGIDAPCRWAEVGRGRLAERELARQHIHCFATPTREQAKSSPSGFYDWMLCGEQVYHAFAAAYPLLGSRKYAGNRVSFETFPHAIACSVLRKEAVSAKRKLVERRRLLETVGVNPASLRSIDAIDAALCAWTAGRLVAGHAKSYGDAAGGYIYVPDFAGQ